MIINKLFVCYLLVAISVACDPIQDEVGDNFDRKVLLTNWADHIIVPAYQQMGVKMDALDRAAHAFVSDPHAEQITALKAAWQTAYLSWQTVDMFEIGKAESLTIRNYINVFPLDAAGVEKSISEGGYDLTKVNRQDEQGFPAIDYLLYGLGDTEQEVLTKYTHADNGAKYKNYLIDVTARMKMLIDQVNADWDNDYRDTFISGDGRSATATVNTLVNKYIFYYEKYLRAGKVGIPAGVFSSNPLADKVEARYSKTMSKKLLKQSLQSAKDFFNGVHFDRKGSGASLKHYLDALDKPKSADKKAHIAQMVNDQFDASLISINHLSDDLGHQVTADNTKMLLAYDALQKNVLIMKVDMMKALSIKVGYVDADGD